MKGKRELSTEGAPARAVPDGILPWTYSCFVCGESNPHGLRLKARHEGGVVVLRYAPRAADRGWREMVHGGIATTLLDEVMTWAAILCAGRACVAAELNVRLKHPITIGQSLRIEGSCANGNPRLMLTRGQIVDETGRVLLEAAGKFVPMEAGVAAACASDFVISPEAIAVERIFL